MTMNAADLKPMDIGGLKTFPVAFDRDGKMLDDSQAKVLIAALEGATDLLVLSHGWKNDTDDAHRLYSELLGNLAPVFRQHAPGRNLAAMLVYWPSKRYTDSDRIVGGAASTDDVDGGQALQAEIEAIEEAFDGLSPADEEARQILQRAKALVPHLADEDRQDDFVVLLRSLMSPVTNTQEAMLPDAYFTASGHELLSKLANAKERKIYDGGAGAIGDFGGQGGGAAGLGSVIDAVRRGAHAFLNTFTYYEMKARAGEVGKGIAEVLGQVQRSRPSLRVHLAGHSFGARAVTAAALAHQLDKGRPLHSLTLLQAAFSHYGFSEKYNGTDPGFFRDVIAKGKVNGPVVITHTHNDVAVGRLYALASRLTQFAPSDVGGPKDLYGGMGANGAQNTNEVDRGLETLDDLLVRANPVPGFLKPGVVYNLDASTYIKDHSDVRGRQVAQALCVAMLA